MDGQAAPIESLLLHGSVITDADVPAFGAVLEVLRASKAQLSFTGTFHTALSEKGLSAPDDVLNEVDRFDNGSSGMVITFGGDGTVLETAGMLAGRPIPVLGINTGRLGFLSHLPMPRAKEALPGILSGGYKVEHRAMLEVDFPEAELGTNLRALNEITVHRRDVASMIRVSVYRDGTFINRYWSDGLIVSTATGSTAYSLSCGGPIIHPDSNAIVLNPIAPHNLYDRPVVIPLEGTLEIHAEGRDDHLMLTMDTRSYTVDAPARFKVRPAERPFMLVQLPGVDFIETVRRKLHLGLDAREGFSHGDGYETDLSPR
jgi:NAD+ kinase